MSKCLLGTRSHLRRDLTNLCTLLFYLIIDLVYMQHRLHLAPPFPFQLPRQTLHNCKPYDVILSLRCKFYYAKKLYTVIQLFLYSLTNASRSIFHCFRQRGKKSHHCGFFFFCGLVIFLMLAFKTFVISLFSILNRRPCL